jgi:ganglioside-induced differentiation-associated protein 1
MPIINTGSAEARNLKGLHLYHFSMSNCSQKARLCLEEKGLQWTSHPVDRFTTSI